MTLRHRSTRSAGIAMLALAIVACETTAADPLPDTPRDGDDGVEPGDGTPADDPDAGLEEADAGDEIAVPCGEATAEATRVLEQYCAGCHSGDNPAAGFGSVLDASAMVDSGYLVPDDYAGSPVYMRMAAGEMPPANVTSRPTEDDIESVRAWIVCGAPHWDDGEAEPLPFVSIDERLELMLDDLRSIPEEERGDVRYVDFSHLVRAGVTPAAMRFLLNSVSQAPELVTPAAVGPNDRIMRVRLSAFGFEASTWERIVANYPYAVQYIERGIEFSFDESSAAELRAQTGTNVPYVQADWLFSHLSRPPLYYDVLDMPATLSGLEQKLGIDMAANIEAQTVSRAGFSRSALSRYNRIVERHTIDLEGRGLWLTYDFAGSAGTANIFTHPLDFTATSSEMFYELPNGLSAFVIMNGAGQRLDTAPTGAVRDEEANGLVIEAGVACLNCHVEDGLYRVEDEVTRSAAISGLSVDERRVVTALYDQEELDAWFEADIERVLNAGEVTHASSLRAGALRRMDDAHRDTLDLVEVAAALNLPFEDLKAALERDARRFPPSIVALTNQANANIRRDAFEALVPELVLELGLGTSITP